MTKNAYADLGAKMDEINKEYLQTTQDHLNQSKVIMIIVFICECVIFIVIGIILIPLLNKVSEISR